jgi:hypothetical protein
MEENTGNLILLMNKKIFIYFNILLKYLNQVYPQRPRIDKLLEQVIESRFLTVSAGVGCGKIRVVYPLLLSRGLAPGRDRRFPGYPGEQGKKRYPQHLRQIEGGKPGRSDTIATARGLLQAGVSSAGPAGPAAGKSG